MQRIKGRACKWSYQRRRCGATVSVACKRISSVQHLLVIADTSYTFETSERNQLHSIWHQAAASFEMRSKTCRFLCDEHLHAVDIALHSAEQQACKKMLTRWQLERYAALDRAASYWTAKCL